LISYRFRDSDLTSFIRFPSIGITFLAIFTHQSREHSTENVFSPFAIRDPIVSKISNQIPGLSNSIQIRTNQRFPKIRIFQRIYLDDQVRSSLSKLFFLITSSIRDSNHYLSTLSLQLFRTVTASSTKVTNKEQVSRLRDYWLHL